MIGTLKHFIKLGARPSASSAALDRQLEKQMAFAMAYLLELGDAHAQSLANAALLQRQRLRAKLPTRAALGEGYRAARLAIQSAIERSPCLLALSFNVPGIELLRALSADAGLDLVLIESPALQAVRDEIPLAHRALPVCAKRDAIKHVKRAVGQGARTVYISFPELHPLSHGTTAPVSFLDKPCRFSVFDPLLCMYGLDTMLTPASDGATLLSWDATAGRDAGQGAELRACLHWLLRHLQASAAAAPTTSLSWHHLYRASLHCYDIERDNQLKQLDAYLTAWKRSPAGETNHMVQCASARISALREAHSRRGARP